jgi:hypothetical protein
MTDSTAYDARMKALVDEYTVWLDANQMPQLSADEQDTERMTPAQRAWLSDFIDRWWALD